MFAKLLRRPMVAVLLTAPIVGLLGSAAPAATGQSRVREIASSIRPADPRVGEYYSLNVTVRNDTHRTMFTTCSLVDWPQGDQPLGARQVSVRLGPGQTFTFRFNFYCGVEGGTVRYAIDSVPAR